MISVPELRGKEKTESMFFIDQVIEFIAGVIGFVASIMFMVATFALCAIMLRFDILFSLGDVLRMFLLSGVLIAVTGCLIYLEDHI